MQGARRSVKPGAKVQRRSEPNFGARRGAPRGPRKRRRPSGLKRWTLRHPWLYGGIRFSLLAGMWGGIVLGLAVIYFIASVPDPMIAALDDRPPNVTVLAQDGTVLAERGLRRGHVRLDVLPPYLVHAVLATEDRRFYQPFRRRSARPGARFVPQRLGRHRGRGRLDHHPAARQESVPEARRAPYMRKLEEVVYAVWLEQRFSKDEILELYLNRVYFGGGTYGVEAASRRYFGKSSRFVTLPQAALLAGLLKAPSRYSPRRSVKLASARVDEVLENMVQAGYLSPEQARGASQQPLKLSAIGDDTGYPYPVDWVAELLPELVGEHDGDLIVETTIDAGLQRVSQQALRLCSTARAPSGPRATGRWWCSIPSAGSRRWSAAAPIRQARSTARSRRMRQPGSAFKPFVYLTALESGYSPEFGRL